MNLMQSQGMVFIKKSLELWIKEVIQIIILTIDKRRHLWLII